MKNAATFAEEQLLWNTGKQAIVGLDEVGRGSWAGPVVVAGVIFPPFINLDFAVADSKLLSPQTRQSLVEKIYASALHCAICEIPVSTINTVGIGEATQIAFRNAITKLKDYYDFILIDAFYINEIPRAIQKPIVHGDRISASIAAASIIAKVYRDAIMTQLHVSFPNYNFDIHKGYGTKAHQQAIKDHGLSDVHRKSFSLEKYCLP